MQKEKRIFLTSNVENIDHQIMFDANNLMKGKI